MRCFAMACRNGRRARNQLPSSATTSTTSATTLYNRQDCHLRRCMALPSHVFAFQRKSDDEPQDHNCNHQRGPGEFHAMDRVGLAIDREECAMVGGIVSEECSAIYFVRVQAQG